MKSRIQAQREEAALRESKECPFRPSLQTRPASANKERASSQERGGGRASTPVHQRLSEEAEEGRKRKEELRKKHEAVEMQQLTFRPTLVASSKRRSPASKQPAHIDGEGGEEGEAVATVGMSHSTPVKGHVFTRLNESASEAKKRLDATRERIMAEEMADVTFQPQLVRTPMSAKYDACIIKPPAVATATGEESPTTVFDRLQYAAMLQKKAKEALVKSANKEYTFQPELNKRAKSAPKRRKPEEAAVPIHERLIRAGERRKSVLIDMVNSKREAELEGCTFTPTINKESEALVLHMIAEDADEEQSASSSQSKALPVPLLHQTPARRQSNFVSPTRRQSATFVAFGGSMTDPRLSAAAAAAAWNTGIQESTSGSPTTDDKNEYTEGEADSRLQSRRRPSSAGRMRRGSVFDRLNVPKTVVSMDMSSLQDDDMVSLTGSMHSRNLSPNRLAAGEEEVGGLLSSSVTSPLTSPKKSAPIRRTSMLLKPTLASALKDKQEDHEAVVRATASLVGFQFSDHKPKLGDSFAKKIDEEYAQTAVGEGGGSSATSPGKPRRRDSVMMPTASSAIKAAPEAKR
jgi:hypothetical protein